MELLDLVENVLPKTTSAVCFQVSGGPFQDWQWDVAQGRLAHGQSAFRTGTRPAPSKRSLRP